LYSQNESGCLIKNFLIPQFHAKIITLGTQNSTRAIDTMLYKNYNTSSKLVKISLESFQLLFNNWVGT